MLMFIIITFVCLSKFFINSYMPDDGRLRTDCYKSFSDPIIFIKLLHYFSSGPLALSAILSYRRYSRESNIEPETVFFLYDFARYDFPCDITMFITTMGSDFEKMKVDITLYHIDPRFKIADIKFNIYQGFKSGEYEMPDINNNFAVKLAIIDINENYFETRNKRIKDFKLYINSIVGKKGELCIVTENNRAAVIKLKKISNFPEGYVTGLYANLDEGYSVREYTAFICEKYKRYHQEKVIFITEKKPTHSHFHINYLINNSKKLKEFSTHKIQISNLNFETFNKLEKIPFVYIKIFLLSLFNSIKVQGCSDGSKVTVYLSKYKMEYYSTITKTVNISTGVEVYSNFQPSPSDPC